MLLAGVFYVTEKKRIYFLHELPKNHFFYYFFVCLFLVQKAFKCLISFIFLDAEGSILNGIEAASAGRQKASPPVRHYAKGRAR